MPNQMSVPAFHITFDFKTRDREKITNKKFIKSFILNTIRKLGMHILHGPNLMKGVPENPGLTAFAVIDFSHIAIHTFILPYGLENEVFIDIFSCKPYDKEKVIESIKKEFNVEKHKINYEVLSFGEWNYLYVDKKIYMLVYYLCNVWFLIIQAAQSPEHTAQLVLGFICDFIIL